jgi:hypothetical protein
MCFVQVLSAKGVLRASWMADWLSIWMTVALLTQKPMSLRSCLMNRTERAVSVAAMYSPSVEESATVRSGSKSYRKCIRCFTIWPNRILSSSLGQLGIDSETTRRDIGGVAEYIGRDFRRRSRTLKLDRRAYRRRYRRVTEDIGERSEDRQRRELKELQRWY